MNKLNLALDNLLQNKRVLFFLIIFIILAAIAVFLLVYKPFWQKIGPGEQIQNETAEKPVVELPQTNPFEEAKTNPFKDIKTNPFE